MFNSSHLQNTKPPQLGPGALPIPLPASHGIDWFHSSLQAFSSIFIHGREKMYKHQTESNCN